MTTRRTIVVAMFLLWSAASAAVARAQSGFEEPPVLKASDISTEDRARLIVQAVGMLARHHATMEPLVQVSAPGPIIARTRAGALLVPVPLDYVPWDRAGGQVRRTA